MILAFFVCAFYWSLFWGFSALTFLAGCACFRLLDYRMIGIDDDLDVGIEKYFLESMHKFGMENFIRLKKRCVPIFIKNKSIA